MKVRGKRKHDVVHIWQVGMEEFPKFGSLRLRLGGMGGIKVVIMVSAMNISPLPIFLTFLLHSENSLCGHLSLFSFKFSSTYIIQILSFFIG